ncbi:MAG TPA: hypothetical protein VM938_06590 [Acidimicrobiales bacterium]|nr:hypothetical protein [Acidimicrobiales bacterium]
MWRRRRSRRPEADRSLGLGDLAPDELAAVRAVVEALAGRDEAVLRAVGAYDDGDPYLWTQDYGTWGRVDVVVPPGEPRTWNGWAVRTTEPGWTSVVVDMWTAQEGRSDLSLELDLHRPANGPVRAVFRLLHVQ